MNFTDLKKNLKSEIHNNYLLVGSDMFLLTRAYTLILNQVGLNMPDMNLQVFAGDSIDLKECAQACNMLPMMDEHRVVYVNAAVKCDISNINAMQEYLTNYNPSTILIVNVGDNTKEFDKLISYFEVVDCNKITQNVINGFVTNELSKHGKSITNSALNMLFDYTSGDMSRIDNEIAKIVSYVGNKNVVDDNDIISIVTKSIDFEIYELTDALAKSDANKVFEILQVLKARKDSYRTLITLIYNHFRRLFYASVTKASVSDMSKMLGVKEFAVNKYIQQAKLFGAKNLKEIVDLCIRLDYETKQSLTSTDVTVEYLVLAILNKKVTNQK